MFQVPNTMINYVLKRHFSILVFFLEEKSVLKAFVLQQKSRLANSLELKVNKTLGDVIRGLLVLWGYSGSRTPVL